MKPAATVPSDTSRNRAETFTIRMAVSAEAAALSRLAQLDSAAAPHTCCALCGLPLPERFHMA